MKKTTKLSMSLAVALIVTIGATSAVFAQNNANGNGQAGNQGSGLLTYLATLPVEQVSAQEAEGLLFTYEEEKLARDVYTALGAKWNIRIFANIAKSEQTHLDAAKLMIDRYQIFHPEASLPAGSFQNATLRLLYADLVARGSVSILDALRAGATIEDLDLRDVTALLAGSDNQDLDTVYQNLAKGSRNHLRAFVDSLAMQSVVYVPQYLDQATFDAIVASDPERGTILDATGAPIVSGTGVCDGTGNGSGNGTGTCDGTGSGSGSGTGTCDGSGSGSGNSGNGNQGGGKP
ncbi:MAG: DUF2202 domain-containing protein [Thermoanaerobaculia bacterium]